MFAEYTWPSDRPNWRPEMCWRIIKKTHQVNELCTAHGSYFISAGAANDFHGESAVLGVGVLGVAAHDNVDLSKSRVKR